MNNKRFILFTMLFSFGCGKEVTFPTQLERQSSVTLAESKTVTQEALISKGSSTYITFEEKTYNISKYSSQMAVEYIEDLPDGTSPVKFTGEVRSDEIIIQKFY
jgi:hypothetical protein